MDPPELRARSSTFADGVTELVGPLTKSTETRHAASQLLRAATSIASNYRAACVARSPDEFSSTLGLVLQEADECVYWLNYLLRQQFIAGARALELADEARQLARIFGASFRTARNNLQFWNEQRRGGRGWGKRSRRKTQPPKTANDQ